MYSKTCIQTPSLYATFSCDAFAAQTPTARPLSAGRAMCLQPTAKHNAAKHWAQLICIPLFYRNKPRSVRSCERR